MFILARTRKCLLSSSFSCGSHHRCIFVSKSVMYVSRCIHNTLFSSQPMNEPNKLECLFLAGYSRLVFIFVGKAGNYPRVEHLKGVSLR